MARKKKYDGRQDVEGKKIGRELLKGIDFTRVRVAILVILFKKNCSKTRLFILI